MQRSWLGLWLTFSSLTLALPASARGRMLTAEPREGEKIRIDGDLREWPAKTAPLSEVLRGPALSAGAVVGYDANHLYLALRTADKQIARTGEAGDAEDHATLTIAFPRGRDYATYEVRIHPGKPGKFPAVVRMNGKAVSGAKAVENPTDTGLSLEAQIPWSAFREAKTTRVGLRAAVGYTNADSPGTVKSVLSTSLGQTATGMPPLLLEGEQALETLLRDNGLSDLATREAYGNVGGGAMYERVAVFGKFLTVSGPDFRQGKEMSFVDLGFGSQGSVTKVELNDFDGDGHAEIVVRKRVGARDKYREILEVMRIGRDDAPFTAFAHEIAVKTPDGLIANRVKIEGPTIEISQGKHEGFEADEYSEPLPSKMPSVLFPWQAQKSRVFRWQGSGFGSETDAPPTSAPRSSKVSKSESQSEKAPEPARLAPRPPTAEEMLDRVYALYRKERGAGGGKPRFDFVTDVVGDATPERVLIHGKDIVVFGKGFRGGASYAFITCGVGDPKDIVDASASDLTGDGKAEIVVRAVLHAKASKALGGDVVDRHAFLVYGIRGDSLVRLFGAETGRSVGKNQILGSLNINRAGGGGATRIELRPSRAIGWTEQTYPFPPDTTAAGGLEPLLLPWTQEKRSYRFDGSTFVRD
jgi:hypothetical protein